MDHTLLHNLCRPPCGHAEIHSTLLHGIVLCHCAVSRHAVQAGLFTVLHVLPCLRHIRLSR